MVSKDNPSYNQDILTQRADIAIIRSQHRVCGVLSGTLPHLSQQNVFLGVPLVLMPEETVLLVDIGTSNSIPNALANCF